MMMEDLAAEKYHSTDLPPFPEELHKPSVEHNVAALNGKSHEKGSNYLTGWRLHTLTLGLCLGIFLVNFEISIVSTSLVSITDDLKHFGQSSWVITAYLLTYTSFMVVLAKLSDVFGRKTMLIFSVFMFTVFSGGCAASQTMIQLIICRVFQGIGGSGVYSLVIVVIFESVPPPKWPTYTVLVTAIFGLSMTLGPIFGGLINVHSRWIWVFLLNVPGGAVTMILLSLTIPKFFPNHGDSSRQKPFSVWRIDFLGAMLLLVAMTLHITGLEQAANLNAWTSAEVLAPLIISLLFWIGFFTSQWYGSKSAASRESVFPWRFCKNRVFMGLIANTFLNGAIQTSCIILIPLRYQAANGSSALQAGIRLIPFSLMLQLGAMLMAVLSQKRRLPPVYLAFFGAAGQLIGCILMSRGPPQHPDWKDLYGFEVLTGTCVGVSNGVVTLMAPYATEKRDHAVATASIVQFRFLGGATVLAIATAVGNTWLRDTLSEVIPSDQVAMIFKATDIIHTFSPEIQRVVRSMFVKSFNFQMRILTGFAAVQLLTSTLLWKREQIMLE